MCGALPADRHRLAVVTEPTASDKRLELSYDAAAKKLSMQDATLGNVRTRANTLLATAALFTSFSAGIGLISTDPTKGSVFPRLPQVCCLSWLSRWAHA